MIGKSIIKNRQNKKKFRQKPRQVGTPQSFVALWAYVSLFA